MEKDRDPTLLVKGALIDALKKASISNEVGDWASIQSQCENYEILFHSHYPNGLPDDSELRKWLEFGRTFLDSWYDSANHGYLYYEPILQVDWPKLAKTIINSIETGAPFQKLQKNGSELKVLYPR